MDHPRAAMAAGLPMEFDSFEIAGQRRSGLPRNGEPFVAPVTPPGSEPVAPSSEGAATSEGAALRKLGYHDDGGHD